MTKSLKIGYILSLTFSAILVAWNTLSAFFSGVGINFVALLGISFALFIFSNNDKNTFKRIKDILFISYIFCFLEVVVYIACEFGNGESLLGFKIYQGIISLLGLVFLLYILFRFWGELTNKRFGIVEMILGNKTRKPKAKKKTKELSNGCLEEKPNNQFKNQHNQGNDIEIIISEDEE